MIRLLNCPVCNNKPVLGVICDKNSIYYSCEGKNHKIIISGKDNNEARKNWNNFVSNVSVN